MASQREPKGAQPRKTVLPQPQLGVIIRTASPSIRILLAGDPNQTITKGSFSRRKEADHEIF